MAYSNLREEFDKLKKHVEDATVNAYSSQELVIKQSEFTNINDSSGGKRVESYMKSSSKFHRGDSEVEDKPHILNNNRNSDRVSVSSFNDIAQVR